MPRTLTAGVTQAIMADAYGYDVLIEAPSVGLRLSWFFAPDDTWGQQLDSVGALEIGVPTGGGVGFVSQLSFVMLDDPDGQSILQYSDDTNLYGAVITLKLLFPGEAYPDALPLFTGQITAWDLRDGKAQITAMDDRLARNILLPQTVVTLATHPNAPDQSIGQAVPLVYGGGNTLAPIPLLLVDQVSSIYQVSSHENGRMIAVFGAWPFGTDRLKTVEAEAEQAVILGTNRLRLLQRLTETKFGVNTAPPVLHSVVGTILEVANLLDGDPASIATLTTLAADGIGRVRLDFVHPDPVGSNTIDIRLLNHRRTDPAAVTVHGSFVLDSIRQDNTVAIAGLFASLERRIGSVAQNEDFRVTGISLETGHILRMQVSAINETGAAGTTGYSYQVGQVVVQASYLVSGPFEPIYLPNVTLRRGTVLVPDVFEEDVFSVDVTDAFLARTDDAAGTITGTPGTVLENPVDVIASILHDELGLQVDPSSIAEAREARATWKMAGGIGAGWYRGRTSSLDFLHSLCLQGGCYLYPKGDGTHIIKAMAPQAPASFFFGPAGSAEDFILYDAQDPGTPGATWTRTLTYHGGRSDQIRNAFEIRYAYHPARQQFSKIAQASYNGSTDTEGRLFAGTVQLLQVSHGRVGPREPYQLDADFLYDDDTVYALLELILPYWMVARQEVEFETTFAPLAMLLGETIRADTPGVPASMRRQAFEIDRLRYDFEQGRMFIHATQRRLNTLDYFSIRDHENTIWYWWVDGETGQVFRDTVTPNFPHTLERDITPTFLAETFEEGVFEEETFDTVSIIPYWLALVDETATTRYIYPLPTGQIEVSATQPVNEPGYAGSPTWVDQVGKAYQIGVNSFEQYFLNEVAL